MRQLKAAQEGVIMRRLRSVVTRGGERWVIGNDAPMTTEEVNELLRSIRNVDKALTRVVTHLQVIRSLATDSKEIELLCSSALELLGEI